jgi:hypothetical protein
MSFSPLPFYLVPSRHKYSPQHPILKHPQPTFRPQFKRPRFTPIQNNRKNYGSAQLNLNILITWKTKYSAPNDNKPLLQSAINFFLNRTLFRNVCFQISELFHPFKGPVVNIQILTSSYILISRHDHVHSFISIFF